MTELSIMAARLTSLLLTLLFWAILIRAILSWVQPDPRNPVIQFLDRLTGPILYPLQRIIPPIGGFDLSPLAALLIIEVLKGLLVHAILNLGG
ncbi:MAG: YggT family protein [Acidithiobacillus sp.]|jgi:YggT family protein|uniref:YggT family protein n=1 Tax=Acidithiobacillus sp. TaxID=1872118 RepID=UPI00356067DE